MAEYGLAVVQNFTTKPDYQVFKTLYFKKTRPIANILSINPLIRQVSLRDLY